MAVFLLTIAGMLVTALGVWEKFMAVLHPRAVVGPVTKIINRGFHDVIRSRFIRSSGLIVYSGPILLVTQTICWATLLVLGVSLIVWPQLGTGIVSSGSHSTDESFATAFYYAGFSITTLGVGDLVPTTAWTKVATVTAAGLGFSYFTLVLAYVVSIYSALARRNQFASEIDYRTQRTGSTIVFLKTHFLSDDQSLLQQDMYLLASNMAELLESHHFYPTLHYFRFASQRYSMSRMLRFCLEAATVARATHALEGSLMSDNPEPAERLWHASLQMLDDTIEHFVVCHADETHANAVLADRLASEIREAKPNHWLANADGFEECYVQLSDQWTSRMASLDICTASQT